MGVSWDQEYVAHNAQEVETCYQHGPGGKKSQTSRVDHHSMVSQNLYDDHHYTQ